MRTSHGLIPIISVLLAAGLAAAPARAQGVDPGGPPLEFAAGQFCIWSGPDNRALADTYGDCNAELSRVEVGTSIWFGGLNMDIASHTSVYNDFIVNGDSGATLDATVTAEVDWNGLLYGLGVAGAGASVKLELFLWSQNAVTGSKTVMSEAQAGIELVKIDIGGTSVSGSDRISFPAKVVRGHTHTIEMRLTCQSQIGLIGADVGCAFMPDIPGGIPGDFHAKWTYLSVSVAADINDRFDALEAKIDALDAKVEALDGKLDEVLRLLHTPPGLRETEEPACQGQACDFPQNPWRRFGNGQGSMY